MTAFVKSIENAVLLLALGILYDTIPVGSRIGKKATQALTGLSMGAIGLLVMATQWTWKPGIVFDTRSVLLSVGGLFFGPVPAAIAVAMTAILRLYQGGGGTLMGVAVIVTSGTIGVAWRVLRRHTRPYTAGELYLFGLAVHAAMLLWMFALPSGLPREALLQVGLPVMVIYPLCTVLLGLLLASRVARRQAQTALQASEEQFRTLARISPVGIFLTDARGQTTYWNDLLAEITGMGSDEGMGTGWIDCLPPDQRERVLAEWRRHYQDRLPLKGQYRLVDRSGNSRWAIVQAVPMIGSRDQILGYMGTVTDVSEMVEAQRVLEEYSDRLEERVEERTRELREAQAQLLRREKLFVLGQMAGGVAHELRNPLGVISNAIYYLRMVSADADATTKEYLDMIAAEVGKAERITSDLLDFARIKASDRHSVTASALVAETLAHYPAPDRVRVDDQVPGDLPPLYVDAHQIVQVLGNLVTNAYQAMPEAGLLTLRAAVEEEGVALSVADTGIGIPAGNRDRLFEPLFTTKAQGIGLGLAISRHLVEANGGTIEVESQEGEGSTFTIHLPFQEDES